MNQESNPENFCPKCKSIHGIPPLEHLKPGEPCDFDPARPCRKCGLPVMALSFGGCDICSTCDAGYERMSPAEQIKTGLEELLAALEGDFPLAEKFRTTELRRIETPDGQEIITRIVTDPNDSSGDIL